MSCVATINRKKEKVEQVVRSFDRNISTGLEVDDRVV